MYFIYIQNDFISSKMPIKYLSLKVQNIFFFFYLQLAGEKHQMYNIILKLITKIKREV